MPVIKAQIVLPRTTGLPEDQVTNTLWYTAPDAVVAAPLIAAAITDFFNSGATQNAPIAARIHAGISRTALSSQVRFYQGATVNDVAGSPYLIAPFTLGPIGAASPGNLALPGEVSCCLSFHGDLSGVPEDTPGLPPGPAGDAHPAARKRGRIYVGPLTMGATVADTGAANGDQLPSGFFINDLAFAAGQLHRASLATVNIVWVVASRRDNVVSPVTGGWVDNAFDTQRRRGVKATARTAII